jgi:hypothetical protein
MSGCVQKRFCFNKDKTLDLACLQALPILQMFVRSDFISDTCILVSLVLFDDTFLYTATLFSINDEF